MSKEPLTEKELSEMAGKPVYCPELECYGIIAYDTIGNWANIPFLYGIWCESGLASRFAYNIRERGLKCYKLNLD